MGCSWPGWSSRRASLNRRLAVRCPDSECHAAGLTPTLWTGIVRDSSEPSRNSRCVASSAARTSLLDTTKEMLHSEEPCAIAMMFTFSRPRAANVRPTVAEPRMFLPTTVTIATVGSSVMCSTFSWARSCANSRRRASSVRSATAEETTRQMSFCEDDCEISRTLARTAAVVAKVRPKTSGTPTIPGPPTEMNATSLIAVSPFTPPSVKGPVGVIRVPGRSGENVLRIHSGMPH